MSFVSVRSCIVGVGGGPIVIFVPSRSETFLGPPLVFPMHEPVLISHGGVVYVISRRPRVVPYLDFQPWFQSLSFNDGIPSLDCVGAPDWSSLMPPPFFPCALDPYEFADPPQITVTSYAAVGSHILLSPQPEFMAGKGTYGFHVVKGAWEKVYDDNLPFAGHAVPLGGSGNLFAACNPLTAVATVFRMSMSITNSNPATWLSIQKLQTALPSKENIPSPLFCPMGNNGFCSIRVRQLKATRTNRVDFTLTAMKILNNEDILQWSEHIHTYKWNNQFRLMDSAMPVVAALSLDTENFELFEGNSANIASQIIGCAVFEAPVIRRGT